MLCLAALVACGTDQTDTSSPSAQGGRTPSPHSTATPEPSHPATPLSRESFPVVVGPESVAGWWDGSRWVPAEGRMPEIPAGAGEVYTIVRLADPLTTAPGSAPEAGCETIPGAASIDIPGVVRQLRLDPPPIAISEVANPRPRPVEVLSPDSAAYRLAAAEALRERGVEDPEPRVVQVVRSDLDGDGRDEVVVVTERIGDSEGLIARTGDYSVVFLRRVVDERPVTTLVSESIPKPQPEQTPFVLSHRVSAVADLNGDGRMEIALSQRYYEGAAVTFFELRADGSVVEVLSSGCGA